MFEGRAQSLQAISTINELTTEASFAVSDSYPRSVCSED
jgi:hypothetical protein